MSLNRGDADSEIGRLSRTALLFCCLVALFPVIFQVYVGLHHLKYSWDDAAITAAFSRTWAHTGRFALTPGSQTVEGFSSILWFLLLSVPYFFTHNPDAGLVWMKVLSAVFLVFGLRIIYLIALRHFQDQRPAIIAMLLLAYCFTSHQEVENGMEMNLAAFLLLLLFHVLTREQVKGRMVYGSILTCLLLLTRFEMPFMLGLLFCGFLYAASRRKPGARPASHVWKIIVVSVLFFGLTEIWRHHVFGEWMPNTVYAKRFLPYRDWSTPGKFLGTRLTALNEPIRVLRFPMAIAIAACLWAKYQGELSWAAFRRIHPAIWMLAFGCFLFGAMFGRNWGPPGRMVADMIPFLILLVVGACVSALRDQRALMGAFAAILLFHGLVWLRHVIEPIHDVPLETVEPLGYGADAIRAALHQDQLVVMMSDVGGSSLCCDRLVVVDSGLLTDSTLARTGWDGFASHFRKVRPELVETHYFWAQDSHIYRDGLLNDYSIVASDGVRFFLRNDLYRKLIAEHEGMIKPVEQVPACMGLFPEDRQVSRERRTCLVLNHPNDERNLG